MICRTTINGTFDTGQDALHIYVTEREGDSTTRLQIFVPVGLYVPAGVKLTIDKGSAYKIPIKFCLSNTCIAGDLAAPALLSAMEAGKSLDAGGGRHQHAGGHDVAAARPVRRRSQGRAGARSSSRRSTSEAGSVRGITARAAAARSIGSISDCAVNGLVR